MLECPIFVVLFEPQLRYQLPVVSTLNIHFHLCKYLVIFRIILGHLVNILFPHNFFIQCFSHFDLIYNYGKSSYGSKTENIVQGT